MTAHCRSKAQEDLLIGDGEKCYPRFVLSCFTTLVGTGRLRKIIEEKVVRLLRKKGVGEMDAVLDASFVKAWSIRHPHDSRMGLSDTDTRVKRAGRTYGLEEERMEYH